MNHPLYARWLTALAALLLSISGCRSDDSGPSRAAQYEASQADHNEPPPDPAYPHDEIAAPELEAHVARMAAVAGPAWTPTWKRPRMLSPTTTLTKLTSPNQGASGFTVKRTRVNYQGYNAAWNSYNQPHPNALLEDVWFELAPPAFPGDTLTSSKWGLRTYLLDGVVRRAVVRGAWKEHNIYSSTLGNLTISDCWLEDAGAQALQLRHTGNRADPEWNNPREIRLVDVHSVECGLERGAGRAGFSISIKDQGPLSDVLFERVAVRTVNQTAVKVYNGQTYDSFGGVCIEYCRTFTWIDGFVHMKKPDRPSIQLFDYSRQSPARTGPDVIDIERLHLDGGALAVRVGDGSLIDISNCTGNGWINCYTWDSATSRWRLDPSMSRPIGQGFYWIKP